MAVSNLVTGVPIDADKEFAGTFFTLLTPFTILGGIVFLLLFLYHGSVFLQLKVGDLKVKEQVEALSPKLGLGMIVATVAWVVYAYFESSIFDRPLAMALCAGAAVLMIVSVLSSKTKKSGIAFITIGVAIALTTATVFTGLFPNIMISTLNPEWSLTIYNASSTPYTLRLMTIIAFSLVPIVLIYQAWSFYIYKKRVTKDHLHY